VRSGFFVIDIGPATASPALSESPQNVDGCAHDCLSRRRRTLLGLGCRCLIPDRTVRNLLSCRLSLRSRIGLALLWKCDWQHSRLRRF
jgi:hypothetical protein